MIGNTMLHTPYDEAESPSTSRCGRGGQRGPSGTGNAHFDHKERWSGGRFLFS